MSELLELDAIVEGSEWLARTAPKHRSQILERIGDALSDASTQLLSVASGDTGLPLSRLELEFRRMVDQFVFFADVVRDGGWLDVSITHAVDVNTPAIPDHRRYNVPLGPVMVFAASNFPLAFGVAGTDTASALAAGCAVVAKPHPGHRRLGGVFAEVLEPVFKDYPKLWSLVQENRSVETLADPRIMAAAFTGSQEGAEALSLVARSRPVPIPFYAEMGSVNPVVVTSAAWSARGDEIVNGLVESMFIGNGQLCTSPGILLIPMSAAPQPPAQLIERGPEPMLTTGMATRFRQAMEELQDSTSVRPFIDRRFDSGRDVTPMVWETSVSAVMTDRTLLAERFGPSAMIVRYQDELELEMLLQNMEGQLTVSIFSQVGDDITRLVDIATAKAGRIVFDAWPTGVAVTWSQHHGGPWPATSHPYFGSVGAEAVRRFLRPVVLQGAPLSALPPAVEDANPWGIPQRVNGTLRAS